MSLTIEDQETTINIWRSNGGATIWTSDTTMMTKLDKLVEKSDHYTCVDVGRMACKGDILFKEYKVDDKTLISFRSNKIRQNLTEEQKQAKSERMREVLAKKKLGESGSEE